MEQADPPQRSPGRGAPWYRSRGVLIAAGLTLLAGLAVVVTAVDGETSRRPTANGTAASTVKPVSAPNTPPAKICGNTKALSGPSAAPAGAIAVSTTQSLHDLTAANPPGTTFWLAPGTHTLGTEAFDQVVPKQATSTSVHQGQCSTAATATGTPSPGTPSPA